MHEPTSRMCAQVLHSTVTRSKGWPVHAGLGGGADATYPTIVIGDALDAGWWLVRRAVEA
jgi:hypothetical protein